MIIDSHKINREIDKIAERWFTKHSEIDKSSLLERLSRESLIEYVKKKTMVVLNKNNTDNEMTMPLDNDDFYGVYFEAVEKIMELYSPERSTSFMAYFNSWVPYKVINALNGTIKALKNEVSLSEFERSYQDGEEEKDDTEIFGTSTYNEYKERETGEQLSDVYFMITNRVKAIQRKNNKNVSDFMRFHADYTAYYVEELDKCSNVNSLDEMKKHEREIFKALDADFLNFFKENKCETVEDIRKTKQKLLYLVSDSVKGNDKTKRCHLPLDDKVYVKYYTLIGDKKSESSISRYREKYREEVRGIINEEYK